VHLPADVPPERAGHHYLDLARGQLLYGNCSAALDALDAARRTAPQQTRYQPMARETVYALARAERRSSSTLRGLAVWMGIQDWRGTPTGRGADASILRRAPATTGAAQRAPPRRRTVDGTAGTVPGLSKISNGKRRLEVR